MKTTKQTGTVKATATEPALNSKGSMPHSEPELTLWLRRRFNGLDKESQAMLRESAKQRNREFKGAKVTPLLRLQIMLKAKYPDIQAVDPKKAVFDAGQWVLDVDYLDGSRKAMGFHGGKLVVCDGVKCQPITLAASLRWFASAKKNWDTSTENEGAVPRWTRMLAKAL